VSVIVTPSSTPDTYNVATLTSSSSGNATIITPSGSNHVRVHYVMMNADGANTADVTAAVRFAAAGVLLYKTSLKAGSIFARNVGAGRRYIGGAAGEALILNLSAAQAVNVTVEYEEVP